MAILTRMWDRRRSEPHEWFRSSRFCVSRVFWVLLVLFASSGAAATDVLQYYTQELHVGGAQQAVRIPVGFTLEVLISALDRPRLLAFNDHGDLFIGSRSGTVYRVPSPYTRAEELVALNDYPHSVAFRKNEILIAQTNGVYRAPYRPGQRHLAAADLVLVAPLPSGGGHNSRTVAVGPDGRVYASLGISGNCSDQYLDGSYPFTERRGGVLVLREEQGKKARWETYASGLRNPVGFDWHPRTGVLYASNNGPDHLGFEQPPEYFSRLDAGSFHGMPWFRYDGERVQRDRCIGRAPPRPRSDVVGPVATFPARNAPMGVVFVPEGALDPRLTGDSIVALHGSWATQPAGGFFGRAASRRPPKLVAVRFKGGEAQHVSDLVTGFQRANGDRWARPVGVAVGPDGALYFTSDAGEQALFRLRPTE